MVRDISLEVDSEIRAANRGRLPRSQPEYERLASRFGYTVQYYPASLGFGNACTADGVIYVPSIPRGARPNRCHIHELAHACENWDGHEPWIIEQPETRTRHEVARCVDLLDPRRPFLTHSLERRISACAGLLSHLIESAGYQSAYVSVNPGKPPIVDLGYKSQ